VVLLLVAQVLPVGRAHTDPPVTAEPAWPDERTRLLAVRACFACHSNTTTWPWYGDVAPASWLVEYDVLDGRRQLNYSEWDRPQRRAYSQAGGGAVGRHASRLVHAAAPRGAPDGGGGGGAGVRPGAGRRAAG